MLLVLMLAIMISGGFEWQISTLKVRMHSLRNPFRVFLLFVILKIWSERKAKQPGILEQIEALLANRYGRGALMAVACLLFVWIKLSQHYTFRTGAFDLAMYDSALSNTLKGRFMYTPWLGRSYFSEHFAPILLLLLPFYLIYDNPIVLMIVQAVAVVLAVFPLYKLAKEYFAASLIPLCLVVVYLNYRYVLRGFMFDFHHEIFEPFLVFSVFLYLRQQATTKYFLFLILALACKEDMPIYMAMLGGYACLVEKKRRLGIATIVITIVWAVVAWKIIIPLSFPDGVQPSRFLVRWSQYGQTYTQIAWNLLMHPSELCGTALKNARELLAPLGFVPVASPGTLLLALPPLLLNSTSAFDLQMNLQAHYALPIVPFLFIALLIGLHHLCAWFPRQRQALLTVVSVYLLVMNVSSLKAFPITNHDLVGHRLLKTLPDGVTIAAQTSFVPHLRRSQHIRLLPYDLTTDYVLFDTQRFIWPMTAKEYQATLRQFLENGQYQLVIREEGFYLFRKFEIHLIY